MLDHLIVFFFCFFQAEDGIRDGTVTGVQTCALPIFSAYLDQVRNLNDGIPELHPFNMQAPELRRITDKPGIQRHNAIKLSPTGSQTFVSSKIPAIRVESLSYCPRVNLRLVH